MQLFLGDQVTITKNEAFISGQVSGIVLDDRKELERLYIHEIDMPFWMSQGWKIVDEDETFDEEDDE